VFLRQLKLKKENKGGGAASISGEWIQRLFNNRINFVFFVI